METVIAVRNFSFPLPLGKRFAKRAVPLLRGEIKYACWAAQYCRAGAGIKIVRSHGGACVQVKMGMRVYKSGQNVAAGGVYHLQARCVQPIANICYFAVLYYKVGLVAAVLIGYASVFYKIIHCCSSCSIYYK